MNVFVCFDVYYDYCNVYETLIHIFADELDAMNWVAEIEANDREWREYREMNVK